MTKKIAPFSFFAAAVIVFLAFVPAAPAQNLGATALKPPPLAKKIVLIGGRKSHGAAQHDFPNGIPLIAAWLKASPAFADVEVLAYTTGFPSNLTELDGASTIVCYFDGVEFKPEPLLNHPERIAYLQKQMDAGVGLVCLHQASTVPQRTTNIPMNDWLGARRDGMVNRTTEKAALKLATPGHPISSGVSEFAYTDEFYPTLIFNPQNVTPILTAELTPRGDHPLPKSNFIVGWAYDRSNGGRSFGFTGGHFLEGLSTPELRKLLINAIAWTAHIDVPKDGIETYEPIVGKASVMKHDSVKIIPQPWGELQWFTSAQLGNSHTMTTGIAILKPGKSNPRHFHPNCDEILHVISGKIRHTMNEVSVEMGPGDTVSIPQGVLHNATNIGDEDAVLAISFSTPYREVIGE